MVANQRKPWVHTERRSNSDRPTRVQYITSALLVRDFAYSLCSPDILPTPGLNIGAYKEAAEHFLSALNLQESTSGDTSDQLWFTLRRVLLSMVCFMFCLVSQSIIPFTGSP